MATLEELEQRIIALEAKVGYGQGVSTVKEVDLPVSTIVPPTVPPVETIQTGGQQVEFIKQSELTDEKIKELNLDPAEVAKSKPASEEEPVEGYDNMTQGEVLRYIKSIKTAAERDRGLAYERAHKNRPDVITAYVNWNS